MKTGFSLVAGAVLLAAALSANADSAGAHCSVTKDGHQRDGQTGPCTFSQRQGNVDLRLDNGDEYRLTMGSNGSYRDQQGRKVRRNIVGEQNEFVWEGGRRIVVTFDSNRANTGNRHHENNRGSGVADLNGTDSIRGIDVMSERGFKDVDFFNSGNTQYGIFYNPRSRECVQLTMANGRIVDARDIQTHPKCH